MSDLYGKRPEYFYKYKHIDKDHLDYSRCIFTDNELYFSTADDFNDPFDCSYRLVINGSEADPEYEQMKVGPEWGICCLSAVRDHILMWAHYANGHRGFCLQFLNNINDPFCAKRRPDDPDPAAQSHSDISPFPITYSINYPVVDRSFDYEQLVRNGLLTKATPWKYEKEWRLLDLNGRGVRKFPSQFLTGVIFGCEMSEDHKEKVREWCKGQPAVKYYQARRADDAYALNIIPA